MSFLNVFKGLAKLSMEGAAPFIPGITETEVINAASADSVPGTIMNSRAVSVDSDGIVKFDFKNDDGDTCSEVKYMAKGTWYHYRNVSKVYRYYKDTTAATATVYGTNGIAVVGLKLHR
jgi:hypothetical protein